MRFSRYIICATVVAVTAVSVGVGAAAGAFNGPKAVPAASSPRPANAYAARSAGLSSVPQDVAAAFHTFRRLSAQPDIELLNNASVLQGLYHPQQYFAANPSLARRVYTGPQGTVYLIPANGQVCIAAVEQVTGGVTVTCVAISEALHNSMGISVINDDGTTTTITGAVPDGVKDVNVVDGRGVSHHVALSADNGYWVSVPAHATKMSMTDTSGAVHELSLPSPSLS